MRGFDPVVCMEAIVRDKLTVFVGPSPMYQATDHPRRKFDLSGLRTCIYTMAPMGRLPGTHCRDVSEFRAAQRQTEMYPATTMSRPRCSSTVLATTGAIAVCQRNRNHGRKRQSAATRRAGELVHRGPNVMLGYYKDPKATEGRKLASLAISPLSTTTAKCCSSTASMI